MRLNRNLLTAAVFMIAVAGCSPAGSGTRDHGEHPNLFSNPAPAPGADWGTAGWGNDRPR